VISSEFFDKRQELARLALLDVVGDAHGQPQAWVVELARLRALPGPDDTLQALYDLTREGRLVIGADGRIALGTS
jgi:hypothetical protein